MLPLLGRGERRRLPSLQYLVTPLQSHLSPWTCTTNAHMLGCSGRGYLSLPRPGPCQQRQQNVCPRPSWHRLTPCHPQTWRSPKLAFICLQGGTLQMTTCSNSLSHKYDQNSYGWSDDHNSTCEGSLGSLVTILGIQWFG